MAIISNFPNGGGSGTGVALSPVSNVSTLVASGKTYIRWSDPENIVLDGITIAEWAGTKLVRKAGSFPKSRRDGTLVLDITNRNQYESVYYTDSGLSNGVTYYYKFFPYTSDGVHTDSEENQFALTPTVQVDGIGEWRVSNIKATQEAGDGKIEITWTDPNELLVVDGVELAKWAGTTVVVKEGSYASAPNDTDAVSIKKTTARNEHKTTPLVIEGLTNGTTYYISFFPETVDGGINSSTTQRTTGVANRISIPTPAQSGTLTYNGSALSPSWSNYDVNKMSSGGVTSAVNAGTYAATFTPLNDYRWKDDRTTGARTVQWGIKKASCNLSLSTNNVTLTKDQPSFTVVVTRPGDGKISVSSNNETVTTAVVNGTDIVISSPNNTSGEAIITVVVEESTNYNASASKSIEVIGSFLPAVGTPLNDCSWDDISAIAESGLAADYFEIGDRKAITVNGTIGTLSVNETYYVYIIGIAHNGATNTIDFGTFKTALTEGIDVSLVDSGYDDGETNGTKFFNMNHWGTHNHGGWSGCDLRYDILGSTDNAPSDYGSNPTSGRIGYDASATCATFPVPNTLMAALPAELRAVMKPMTIYTDNTGGSNDEASHVTATVDYLPLLAEYEIFGDIIEANSAEENYQAQYAYYSMGNSETKYRHSATISRAIWWQRSVGRNSVVDFCEVVTNGSSNASNAKYSSGIAPVFRV